ncbi:polysaccharide deacetylase family protein [Thalassotalea sp. PLHSN55]|uniref:polysaccharide deacetylase family protein n=1 Tax=Thalassotalea sp. PLHSN55 TaxID=3435888 RepID=UPI003F870423
MNKFRWQRRPNGLYCFNYHRIGDDQKTEFDPNVFSCTQSSFEKHLEFYQENFIVLTLPQALDLIHQGQPLNEKYALLTFDDGYIDNYTVAMPSLLKHDLSAVFHLPSDYISSNVIPWWDEIAWMVKHTKQIKLQFGQFKAINLVKFSINKTIRLVMNRVKEDTRSMDEKLDELRLKLKCELNTENAGGNLFLSWQQVSDMVEKGMYIGSHTRSHRILSHLPLAEQIKEMSLSKDIIESHLSDVVSAIAYPVGDKESYCDKTCAEAEKLGYQIGFSFEHGINTLSDQQDNFKLKRIGIDGDATIDDLKKRICS